MSVTSAPECDELTICSSMDGNWIVSVVIDCSWHPDEDALMRSVHDEELRGSIKLLLESYKESACPGLLSGN
jgi:hypothetical protein